MIARQREKRANSVKAIGVNRVKIQDGRANRDRPGRGRVTVQIHGLWRVNRVNRANQGCGRENRVCP